MYVIAQRYRKYLENAFWLTLEKGFTLLAGVVVGIYVARYLRPDNYGLLNYSISFVGIFSALSTLGLDQIVVRELSKGHDRSAHLLGTGFVLKTCGSLSLILLLGGVLTLANQDRFTNTMIMIIAMGELFRGFEVISNYYQSRVLSKYVVQTQVLMNLLVSAIKLVLVATHSPLIWFAFMVVLGTMLQSIGYFSVYRLRDGSLLCWRFSKALALDLIRESWPLAIYGIALNIQARIDQVMLGQMLNNAEVGQYSVALKIIEIFGFVPMALMSTFTPAVTRAKVAGRELYHRRMVSLYRLMFTAFLLVATPLYFLGENIVILLYGEAYRAAGCLLSLFSLRLFFTNMGVGKSVFIVNESLFKYSLATVIVGAITNIGLNLIMIPIYGTTGAIVASLISFAVSIFTVDFFYEKTRRNLALMVRGMTSFWKLNDGI